MTFGRLDHKPIVRPNPYGTLLFSRFVIPVFAFSRRKIIASAGFEWFRIKPLKIFYRDNAVYLFGKLGRKLVEFRSEESYEFLA